MSTAQRVGGVLMSRSLHGQRRAAGKGRMRPIEQFLQMLSGSGAVASVCGMFETLPSVLVQTATDDGFDRNTHGRPARKQAGSGCRQISAGESCGVLAQALYAACSRL